MYLFSDSEGLFFITEQAHLFALCGNMVNNIVLNVWNSYQWIDPFIVKIISNTSIVRGT